MTNAEYTLVTIANVEMEIDLIFRYSHSHYVRGKRWWIIRLRTNQ